VPQDPLDAVPVLMPFLMQVPDPRGQLNVLLIMRRDRPLLPLVISLPRHFQHTHMKTTGKRTPGGSCRCSSATWPMNENFTGSGSRSTHSLFSGTRSPC